MAAILNAATSAICNHGGQVQPSASITRVLVAGQAPLAPGDAFPIVGCPFVAGGSPHPCTGVEWLTATARVTAQGKPLLLEASTALCKAADGAPQGTPTVLFSQRRVTAR